MDKRYVKPEVQEVYDRIIADAESQNIHANAKKHRIRTVKLFIDFCDGRIPNTAIAMEFFYNQIKNFGRRSWGLARVKTDLVSIEEIGHLFRGHVCSIAVPKLYEPISSIIEKSRHIKDPMSRVYYLLRKIHVKQNDIWFMTTDSYMPETGTLKGYYIEYVLPMQMRPIMEDYITYIKNLNPEAERVILVFPRKGNFGNPYIHRLKTKYWWRRLKSASTKIGFNPVDDMLETLKVKREKLPNILPVFYGSKRDLYNNRALLGERP